MASIDPVQRLQSMVEAALAVADELGLTEVGIRLDQARIALISDEQRAREHQLLSRNPEGCS